MAHATQSLKMDRLSCGKPVYEERRAHLKIRNTLETNIIMVSSEFLRYFKAEYLFMQLWGASFHSTNLTPLPFPK